MAADKDRHTKRVAALKTLRKDKNQKKSKRDRNQLYHRTQEDLTKSYKHAEDVIARDEALDRMESDDEDNE